MYRAECVDCDADIATRSDYVAILRAARAHAVKVHTAGAHARVMVTTPTYVVRIFL